MEENINGGVENTENISTNQQIDNQPENQSNQPAEFEEKYLNQKKRAEKAEAELKKLKEQLKEGSGSEDFWKQKVDFLITHPEVREDFKVVEAFAKAKGVSLEEAYNDDEVKDILSYRASKRESLNKVPESSGSEQGTRFEYKPGMSEEEFRRLEEEELKRAKRQNIV